MSLHDIFIHSPRYHCFEYLFIPNLPPKVYTYIYDKKRMNKNTWITHIYLHRQQASHLIGHWIHMDTYILASCSLNQGYTPVLLIVVSSSKFCVVKHHDTTFAAHSNENTLQLGARRKLALYLRGASQKKQKQGMFKFQ